MIAQGIDGLWSGWGGTAVFILCWLLISRISAISFPLWVGLMLLAGGAYVPVFGMYAAF